MKLKIKTKTQNYPIIIGSNLIPKISKLTKNESVDFNKCLLIIDRNVPKKMVNKIIQAFKQKKIYKYYFIASEKNKSQNNLNLILKILLEKNFSRTDCLISIGGGITGDLGGFAASLFKRGIKFINIPTTLLSQVDSSVGGKTGINTKYGKNLIGSFYQPNLVISDINFLRTLPKREIVCGYGEILKHSIIANKNFYKFLNKNVTDILKLKSPFIENAIFKSCQIKKAVVEKDEKEKSIRKILNFGHTFAHAYEASLNYSKKLNHGEAVLLGMNSALSFSNSNKMLSNKEYQSVKNHIKNSKLPFNIRNYFKLKDLNKIVSFMTIDKKNYSDKINLILLRKIGNPEIGKEFTRKKIKFFLKKELTN